MASNCPDELNMSNDASSVLQKRQMTLHSGSAHAYSPDQPKKFCHSTPVGGQKQNQDVDSSSIGESTGKRKIKTGFLRIPINKSSQMVDGMLTNKNQSNVPTQLVGNSLGSQHHSRVSGDHDFSDDISHISYAPTNVVSNDHIPNCEKQSADRLHTLNDNRSFVFNGDVTLNSSNFSNSQCNYYCNAQGLNMPFIISKLNSAINWLINQSIANSNGVIHDLVNMREEFLNSHSNSTREQPLPGHGSLNSGSGSVSFDAGYKSFKDDLYKRLDKMNNELRTFIRHNSKMERLISSLTKQESNSGDLKPTLNEDFGLHPTSNQPPKINSVNERSIVNYKDSLDCLCIIDKIDGEGVKLLKTSLLNHPDFMNGNFHVDFINLHENRNCYIHCESIESRNAVYDLVKLKFTWSVRKIEHKHIYVRFGPLDINTSPDEFITSIIKNNKLLADCSPDSFVYFTRVRHGEGRAFLVYKINFPIGMNLINSGFIHYQLSKCKVYEFKPLLQCHGCSRFGHTIEHCRYKRRACPNCSGSHTLKQCNSIIGDLTSELSRCANCSRTGLSHLDFNHSSWNKKCPIRKKFLDKLLRSDGYRDQHFTP